MRAYILSTCALILGACGGAEAETAGAGAASGEFQVAQNDAPDLSGLPEAYRSANLNNGRTQWFLCAACHQINNGTSHSVGPDLFHIFGNTAGSNATFPIYSQGLKDTGIVWTAETIDTWITNPRNVVSATTMIFPGIADAEDRRDVIAYLWVQTGGDAE
jgi:cytochrome c